jgi:peptide/nickel transport system substrate-binding protein
MTRNAEDGRQALAGAGVRRREFVAGAGALAGLVLLPGCGADQSSAGGGTLVVAIDETLENLDPATNIEFAFGLRPVYETLLTLKDDTASETKPGLASSVEANRDKSVWTFRLQDGVLFHDGTRCDAKAVKETITRSVTLKGGIGYLWGLEDADKQITVVDPQTLRFDLGTPHPVYDLEVASQYGFWLPSPTAAKKHSAGPEDQGHKWLQSHPVGTGPYRLTANDPGQQVTYTKFGKYWRGWRGNHFDRVIVRTIPEHSTRRQLLERGEVQAIVPGTPEDTVKLREDPRFTVADGLTYQVQYFALGSYGPLADPRARLAMNHAWDRQGYISDIQRDTVMPTHGVFPDLLPTTDQTIENPEYDLQKAKQLFDAAGVREGTEFTVEIFTGYGVEATQLLQQSLSQIGLKLKIVEKSYSAFIADYFSDAPAEQRANMYFFSWWPNYGHPYDWSWVLYSKDAWGSAGANVGFYSNPEVDKLIASMYNAPFGPELEQKSHRLQRILSSEDPPWIPTAQIPDHFAFQKEIKGHVSSPVYILTLDLHALHRDA